MRKTLRNTSLVSGFAVLLLSGCVVGPDYKTPSLLTPASWNASYSKTAERPPEFGHWWTRLNDPLLNSYVERAVSGNLDVGAAIARVSEARATLAQDRGTLLPAFSNSDSVRRTKVSEVTATGENPSTQYQSGFDASWEIDLFGGRQRSVEAARYGLDASEEDLRNTLLTLVGDVSSNYAQVRAAQARLSLARRTARSQRDTVALTRAKAEAGTATASEVSRAEGLAATTEAEIPSIEISRATAVHRLGVLLGLPPAELARRLEKSAPIPRPRFPMPVGIPADTLLTRPDVRLAERRLAQSTARIGAAEAARYPSISLTGNIASQALTLGDIAEKSTIGWSIGPAISIPIFRGGQLKAAVDIAKARRDGSAAAYQATVLTAMEDVENAIVSLNQNRARNGKLASAASSYRSATRGAQVQYEGGSLEYLNLLDSQRAQYQAESALIDSQLAVTQAYIALNKALGGGWTGAIPDKLAAATTR
ncbi:Toluene efflux pump outer membrane protein TtgI precursor [compost metagenome]